MAQSNGQAVAGLAILGVLGVGAWTVGRWAWHGLDHDPQTTAPTASGAIVTGPGGALGYRHTAAPMTGVDVQG